MPYSAPILVQMMRSGWDPLINFGMMFEHDPFSQQTAIANSTVGGIGLLANRQWVNHNKDLAYRVLSAAYRTFELLDDPETQYRGWEIEADLINNKRQLSMEPRGHRVHLVGHRSLLYLGGPGGAVGPGPAELPP